MEHLNNLIKKETMVYMLVKPWNSFVELSYVLS